LLDLLGLLALRGAYEAPAPQMKKTEHGRHERDHDDPSGADTAAAAGAGAASSGAAAGRRDAVDQVGQDRVEPLALMGVHRLGRECSAAEPFAPGASPEQVVIGDDDIRTVLVHIVGHLAQQPADPARLVHRRDWQHRDEQRSCVLLRDPLAQCVRLA
jgi:hypothetical protein